MQIKATITFAKNYKALFNGTKRYIVNQGSSRSGKTWGLCQLLIIYALKNRDTKITIVRKSFNALKKSAMEDFFKVLKQMDIYNVKQHNKTDNFYQFSNGSIVMFISADDEQKLRGLSSDIVWANEGNELYHDDFLQLDLRCTGRFIVDYNPSDADSWIYNLPEAEKILIKSTFKDNPFLAKAQVKVIKQLKETDPDLYQIYGLGERTTSRKNVYQGWNIVTEKPERFKDFIYGLDFGYNHPTALMRVWWYENELYLEPLIYESYLTTAELIEKMNELEVDKFKEIMCDYSRPEAIKELTNADYNAINGDKAVKAGINNMKSFKIFINEKDEPLVKEYKNYMWKKVGDKITDEPVKSWDDMMDASRYAAMQIKKDYVDYAPLISF